MSEIQKLTGIPHSTLSTLKSRKGEVKKSVTLTKKLFTGNTESAKSPAFVVKVIVWWQKWNIMW